MRFPLLTLPRVLVPEDVRSCLFPGETELVTTSCLKVRVAPITATLIASSNPVPTPVGRRVDPDPKLKAIIEIAM